jgi:hypothetical protein
MNARAAAIRPEPPDAASVESAAYLLRGALDAARAAAAVLPCPETAGAVADIERRIRALVEGRAVETREAALRRLHSEGASMREIARALGLAGPSSVHRQLFKLGLAGMRPYGRRSGRAPGGAAHQPRSAPGLNV